jgi:hypothetical protein
MQLIIINFVVNGFLRFSRLTITQVQILIRFLTAYNIYLILMLQTIYNPIFKL